MSIAMYPGSFDPVTNGHIDIIERASHIFDKVVVAILVNSKKVPTFTPEERKEMIEKAVSHLPNVEVMIGSGLTVDFARSVNAKALVKGVRTFNDYEYELQQASANSLLAPDVETVLLIAKPEYSFISSTIAKEIASYGSSLKGVVPKEVEEELIKRLKK